MQNQEHFTLISKWGERKTGRNLIGRRIAMKQIVIKVPQGFKRKDGKLALKSFTMHIPV